MTTVAHRFGVSGNFLARVCTVLNVPRPERGYWAKLAVGKAPVPEGLPDARPGDQLHWSKEGGVMLPSPTPLPPVQHKLGQKRRPRAIKSGTHAVLVGARAHFENSRAIEDGAYLKPYKRLLVDIPTSKACLDKAFALANDLFNALETAGHRVMLASGNSPLRRADIDERERPGKPRDRYHHRGIWSPDRPTVVYIGTVAIGLTVVEMSEDVVLRYIGGKYIREADYAPPKVSRFRTDYTSTTTKELPSGRLRIIAYYPSGRVEWRKEWQESAKKSLTSNLKAIVRSIESAVPDLVAKLEEAERQDEIARQERLVAHEKSARSEDKARIGQSQRDSKEELANVIGQWSAAISVENFLAEAERRVTDLADTERAAVLDRLQLARAFLGGSDPLDFIRSWRTPGERYRPRYEQEAAPGEAIREGPKDE